MASRGAISCALGCPYEGEISPERVELVVRLMKEIGVQHVGVADTIGVGTPRKVQAAIEATLKHFDIDHVSGHFHDTYGQAVANTLAALEMGVWHHDTSVAGLGGCPYAKGATGNVATEDVVYLLHGMGIDTGIDLDALVDTGAWISEQLGRSTNSRVARALIAKRKGSVYEPGRRRAWLKYKLPRSQEFVIGGYTAGNPFDARIVGCYEGEKLRYVGKVRAGFVPHMRCAMMPLLGELATDQCPFADLPHGLFANAGGDAQLPVC